MELSETILKTIIDAGIGVLAIVAIVLIIRQFGGDSQRNDGLMKQLIDLMSVSQRNTEALTRAIDNNTTVVRAVSDIPAQLQQQQTENTTQIKTAILSMSKAIAEEQQKNRDWSILVDGTLGIFTDRFDEMVQETQINRDRNSAAHKDILGRLDDLKQRIEIVQADIRERTDEVKTITDVSEKSEAKESGDEA